MAKPKSDRLVPDGTPSAADVEIKALALRASGKGVLATARAAGCGVSAVQRIDAERKAA